MSSNKRIGIDFDNTIIDYDRVFHSVALRQGLVDARCPEGKQAVREALRDAPDGEAAWQRLQGQVYGAWIGEAALFDGVEAFLRQCRAQGHEVMIVSHKTEYGHFDPARINLRLAAREWMARQGFFLEDGIGIRHDNVFFEATREDKIRRIASLDCTHFIDDLPEVLEHPDFPDGVTRILFTGSMVRSDPARNVFSHWRDIAASVLA